MGKVDSSSVSESHASDAADEAAVLDDQSLAVSITQPSDTQVNNIRLYRTLPGGSKYYLDSEIEANVTYTHGYSEGFEKTDAYISGTGFKFTIEDTTNGTENTLSGEELVFDRDEEGTGGASPGTLLDDPDDLNPGDILP